MTSYWLPIFLVIISNTAYQIIAKSTPANVNPLASLAVTYLVGSLLSFVLLIVLNKNISITEEFSKLNWTAYALGFAVVGIEVGTIYAYQNGWPVSLLSIVQCSFVTIILIFVGYFLFKERFDLNKILGIVICLIGLYFINK